jgi:hypothetical protein
MYDLPRMLAEFTDDEWTFEDEVDGHELGHCAIHIDFQEPWMAYT